MRNLVPSELPERGPMDRQYRKVYGPRRTTPIRALILGQRILGILTHFDGDLGRSIPCSGDGTCGFCMAKLGRRWKGYIDAIALHMNERCIIEITEGAARSIMENPLSKPDLRGKILTLKRLKPHATAPVFATLEIPPKQGAIPAEQDITPDLERFW